MRFLVVLTTTCFIGLSLQGRVLFPDDQDQSSRFYRKLNNFYHKLFKNSVSSEETINNEINDSSFVKFKDVKSAEIVEPITLRNEFRRESQNDVLKIHQRHIEQPGRKEIDQGISVGILF